MTTIFKNENLQVIQQPIKNKYTIEFNKYTEQNAALIRSLIRTRIIQGATLSKDYLTLKFQAHSVNFFSQTNTLSIPDAAKYLETLATQLNYLLQHGSKTILGYNPNQIIVINETPAFLGSEFIADLDYCSEGTEPDLATICCPFNPLKDFFPAPELLKIKHLPAQVHFKVAYYSLATLIIYGLNKEMKTEPNINPIIYLDTHPIKNTKLYWLLSRCLEEDPNKRSIVFI